MRRSSDDGSRADEDEDEDKKPIKNHQTNQTKQIDQKLNLIEKNSSQDECQTIQIVKTDEET